MNQLDVSEGSQGQLFDGSERERLVDLDRVSDQIAARFGKRAIRRGAGLPKREA